MKTYTRTVVEREGEWLDPVDETYDVSQHTGVNEDFLKRGLEMVKRVQADPKDWRYSPSGFISYPVTQVGMYDGWPYWKPTPAIGYIGPLGTLDVAFFYNLSEDNLAQVNVNGVHFTSTGLGRPSWEPICSTCPFLERAVGRSGGWCTRAENWVPPSKGWPDGFKPSVSSTGGCDLHPDAKK